MNERLPYAYAAFGVRIAATAPIPGLPVSADRGCRPDVVVRFASSESATTEDDVAARGDLVYCSPERDDAGRVMLTVRRSGSPARFCLSYADGVRFVIGPSGADVSVTWPASSTLADVATYLLGPVFAFLLRLRGVTCLHASAVAVGDRAVAFAGPAGAGKSTLAAALALRGYPVMADDVVAVADDVDGLCVEPGPVRIRLWPDSVRALYGTEDALPTLTPTWDKRYLDVSVDGHRYQDRRLPLAAVYVLSGRDAPLGGHPRFEPLSAPTALIELLANAHSRHLADTTMRAQEFQILGRLAGAARVTRIAAHEDLMRLTALCNAVVEDLHDSAVGV